MSNNIDFYKLKRKSRTNVEHQFRIEKWFVKLIFDDICTHLYGRLLLTNLRLMRKFLKQGLFRLLSEHS